MGGRMSLSLIVLGLIGWALVLSMALVLMRMSGDQDRAAREEEKRLVPFSDVTVTQYGNRLAVVAPVRVNKSQPLVGFSFFAGSSN
jgi:hypothetical protein